jgi:hypothetical protein
LIKLGIPKKVALVPLLFFLTLVILPVVDNLNCALFKLNIMPGGAIGPCTISMLWNFSFSNMAN